MCDELEPFRDGNAQHATVIEYIDGFGAVGLDHHCKSVFATEFPDAKKHLFVVDFGLGILCCVVLK